MNLRSLLLRAFSATRSGLRRCRACRLRSLPTACTDHAVKSDTISASEIRREFAHHEPGIARINNGSFGCCPASVLAAQSRYQLLYLRQPDDFYFNVLRPSILCSRHIIRDLINATDVEGVSIVDNVTTAAAVVLQHISWAFREGRFSKGDAVIMLQHTYGAVKNAVHAYVSRSGGHVIEASLPFPVNSNEEIILEFRKALSMGKSNGCQKVRLAVIDHITSMPAVVIPVKQLTKICREEGVDQVFVDGAHAIGNVEIDVEDIGADFYTSNLHKWFFCPPAAAFLYCRATTTADLHHPMVSHNYGKGLAVESSWVGTRDYSPQLVLPSIMDFVDRFEGGIEGIRKRNHDSAVAMGKMLADSWGTSLGSLPDMCSSMVMVGLPGCLEISSDGDAFKLRKHLREEFQVEVHIYYNNEDKQGNYVTGYVRISHQVYNVVDDYYKLRDAVNKLVSDGFHCGGVFPSN